MNLRHRTGLGIGGFSRSLGGVQLSVVRFFVLVNMAFNMGIDGLLEFHEMLSALQQGNYEAAAQAMENSLWYWSNSGGPAALAGQIDMVRRGIAEGLVESAAIVELKARRQRDHQLRHAGIALQIDILVLDAAPEPLHKDVVQGPTATIHADLDTMPLEHTREGFGGELAAAGTR